MSGQFGRDFGQVTAVLGPTNTGKTHLAIERMLARRSGMIGLPLRLLAREIYDRIASEQGEACVALITGEEKIVPKTARYYICTVESMPMGLEVAFVAIDEVQLAADPERGHVFTDRLLNARGTEETMLLGSRTIQGLIRKLVPEAEFDERERFSQLTYSGPAKLTRLPRRSAVVAFSADQVYAIADLLKRRRGGAAVVMGGLSPRTRNAQVELYQSGEVDFLVATDAIGMGLNMDVEHVAFAAAHKFDGRKRRPLMASEMAQIAGRAGRFRTDGTFGETGDCLAFDPDLVRRIEAHSFAPLRNLQWRNPVPDESTLNSLITTLDAPSPDPVLRRAREAMDEQVLNVLADDAEIRERAIDPELVQRLWDVCRLPDFRKATLDAHARLVKTIYIHLTTGDGFLPVDWLDGHLTRLDRMDGDVDALATRLTHVRTWSYAAHRIDWTADPNHWRDRAREIEDKLSDALHEKLMQRFVDRRTQALVKGLADEADMLVGVSEDGEVTVEGHFLGRLEGLNFRADTRGKELEARTVNSAALKALRPEVDLRLGQLIRTDLDTITLDEQGQLLWRDYAVAKLVAGTTTLKPVVQLIGGELGSPEARSLAQSALQTHINSLITTRLAPLFALKSATDGVEMAGPARGLAWRLFEAGGVLPRDRVAEEITALEQNERRGLRALGVKIGEHVIYVPALVKPAPARLNAQLRHLANGRDGATLLPGPGLTSVANDRAYSLADYIACGFYPCGARAVRLDILERFADLIREARTKTGRGRFELLPSMTGILGCSVADLRSILSSLNYRRLKEGPDPEKAEGEIWVKRSMRPASKKIAEKPRMTQPIVVDADNPFAALAGLKLETKQPTKTKPRKKSRRRPVTKKSNNVADKIERPGKQDNKTKTTIDKATASSETKAKDETIRMKAESNKTTQ